VRVCSRPLCIINRLSIYREPHLLVLLEDSVDVAMVQPEDWVEGRLERGHDAAEHAMDDRLIDRGIDREREGERQSRGTSC